MTAAINKERLLSDLFGQGKIGWHAGKGMQRAAYSEAYAEAREWFEGKMRAAGLKTRVDGVGNLFGRLEGRSRRTIMMGSHLDSVDNGGIYDGPLGVAAALEVIRSIKESGAAPEHSLEVGAFIGEEGEPLGGTFGSRAFAGLLPSGYRRETLDGFGVSEEAVTASKGNLANYAAFFELHIEQGPFLERRGLQIGVPFGIVGVTRLNITVKGETNHAGTTPMAERKDAMRAAADFIHSWFEWMDGRQNMVCNVGVLEALPGHVSVVPGEVRFVLELRSVDDSLVKAASVKALEMSKMLSPCSALVETLGAKPAVMLDERLVKMIKESAAKAGFSAALMPSGASHDSSPIAHVMPTGMIFVPSHNGVSHSKDEFTSEEDLLRGVELLKYVVCEADRRLE